MKGLEVAFLGLMFMIVNGFSEFVLQYEFNAFSMATGIVIGGTVWHFIEKALTKRDTVDA